MTAEAQLFNEENAARYKDRWAKLAPLAQTVHLLAGSALRGIGARARVLCVGAGTGAELVALSQRFPGWRFLAVDPAEPMLRRAEQAVADIDAATRCEFFVGTLDQAPPTEPFDAATSILVSHFLTERAARVAFFREILARLKPGAPLVTADISAASKHGVLGDIWDGLLEHCGLSPDEIVQYRAHFGTAVSMLPPEELEALLAEAGFTGIEPIFQAGWMRAWVARAP